jgi:hypothetical protein
MGTLKPKMAESLREIQHILLHEWDPIGVRSSPAAESEYDSYAVPIYSFLRHQPSETELVDHLYQIETKRMGLTRFGMRRHLKPVAKRLLEVDLSADEPLQ